MNGRRGTSAEGFTLIELAMVMAAIVTMAAVLVPSFRSLTLATKARDAARLVERELQTARLKAVTVSRTMRVRFNCPAPGQFRVLELTGIAATDTAANRCSPAAFPYPGPMDSLRATPQFDSPVFHLPTGTTLSGAVTEFEFDPRANVYSVSGATVTKLTADTVLTISRQGYSNTVTVNALGRIRLN